MNDTTHARGPLVRPAALLACLTWLGGGGLMLAVTPDPGPGRAAQARQVAAQWDKAAWAEDIDPWTDSGLSAEAAAAVEALDRTNDAQDHRASVALGLWIAVAGVLAAISVWPRRPRTAR